MRLLLLLLLLLPELAFGQTSIIRGRATIQVQTTTVAGLPGSPPTGTLRYVTDGASSTDCTIGSGSTAVLCIYNGTDWYSVGSTGGAEADTLATIMGRGNTYYGADCTASKALIVGDSATDAIWICHDATDGLRVMAVVGGVADAGDKTVWIRDTYSYCLKNRGTGASLFCINGTTGAITFPDGVKQTFNPDGTTAGINVGSQAGDVGTPANGDIWYNSSTEKFRCRENGATSNCIGSGTAVTQLHVFRPQQNEPPASSFATMDTRNSHPILLFVDSSDTSAVFSGIMNRGYSGGDMTIDVHFSMAGAVVTNAVGWCAQVEALVSQDIDSDGFPALAAGLCASTTVSGTDGGLAISSIALTNAEADSIAAGGAFRLKITRDGDGTNVTDSATGTAQLRLVEIRQ